MSNVTTITRDFNGTQIRQRKSDGFLDATAMCKATGKLFGHYKTLESTQAFLSALSTDIGYPISELIQSVKGGHPENQGTWVHPQVAINLAQWCSPEFAVLVSKWVFELLTTDRVELQPAALRPSMLEFAHTNRELMQIFGIESNMQTIALNNAMKKEFGVNLLDTWGMDGGLQSETQEQLYTVTEIAQNLGVSRTTINPILVKLGFQTVGRDHKEQKKYELTGKGREYGIYLDVGKRRSDGTPVRQLKWYESVIDKIKEHLESQFTGLTA